MSTKIAVIIGDYSNGWSDSWFVQQTTSIPNIKEFVKDRESVHALMSAALKSIIDGVEKNPRINPAKAEEPCCEAFKPWADGQKAEVFAKVKFCGPCGTEITPHRRETVKTEVPF